MKRTSFKKLVTGMWAKEAPVTLWQPPGQLYPRLMGFDPTALAGREGLYAIWHLGVRPQWLRVGLVDDLALAFASLACAPWVVLHEGNAGIFLAWAYPPPLQAMGMARYLVETLKPTFQSAPFSFDRALEPAAPPFTCSLPPGTQPL
jgi:hypothetical protein